MKPTLTAVQPTREPLFLGNHVTSDFVIFLDFDGVLHPLGPGQSRFSNAPIFLATLYSLQALGVHPALALSTAWRFQPMALILSELDRAAPGLASFVEGRCGHFDATEVPVGLGTRYAEILDYCQRRLHGIPKRFAMVDDQISLFSTQYVPDGLILCNPFVGFLPEHGVQLAAIALISSL